MEEETVNCPFCAEPIKSAAIKCKHCGSDLSIKSPAQQGAAKALSTPPRTSKIFRGSTTALCLIALLGIAIFVFGTSKTEKQTAHQETSSLSAASPDRPDSEDTRTSKIETFKTIGERFDLGDFSYKFSKIEWKERLGNEFVNREPESGGIYLIVHFEITNNGSKSATIPADTFTLQTADGDSYSPDSDAIATLMMSGGKHDWLLAQLHPGLTKSSLTVFSLPSSKVRDGLYLRVPQEGLFSTGETLVVLSGPIPSWRQTGLSDITLVQFDSPSGKATFACTSLESFNRMCSSEDRKTAHKMIDSAIAGDTSKLLYIPVSTQVTILGKISAPGLDNSVVTGCKVRIQDGEYKGRVFWIIADAKKLSKD